MVNSMDFVPNVMESYWITLAVMWRRNCGKDQKQGQRKNSGLYRINPQWLFRLDSKITKNGINLAQFGT